MFPAAYAHISSYALSCSQCSFWLKRNLENPRKIPVVGVTMTESDVVECMPCHVNFKNFATESEQLDVRGPMLDHLFEHCSSKVSHIYAHATKKEASLGES